MQSGRSHRPVLQVKFKLIHGFGTGCRSHTQKFPAQSKIQAVDLEGKLPLAKVSLSNSFHCLSLLDSGSSRSFVSKDLFEKLTKLKLIKRVNKINQTVEVANQSKVTVRKEIVIHIKIENFSWDFQFWVLNSLPFQMILGYDFMKFSKMTVDLNELKVRFNFSNKETVFCLLGEDEIPQCEKPDLGDSPLSPAQKKRFDDLIQSFGDVISDKIGTAKVEPYKIRISEKITPFRQRPYFLSPEKMKIMRETVQDLLNQGVIEKSVSEFSSSAFLRPKKEPGKYRLVVNYKELNKHIEMDSFPQPEVDKVFHFLKDARYFTTLDLNNSYYQCLLHPDSRKFAAFNVGYALYQPRTCPQGIKIGSQVLGRIVDEVLGDLKFKCVINFVDDLCVYSSSPESHYNDLKQVLLRLRQAGLTVKPSKVTLAKRGIRFLSHIVKDGKLQVDSSKSDAINNFPRPKNLKAVQRFLGMAAYYSKFIPNFSEISRPLNALKRKNVRFKWGTEQQQSFDKIRQCLASPVVLHLPDWKEQFILSTDASERSVGCCLEQYRDGRTVPIAFASRSFSDNQLKYSIYLKEFAAVLYGLEKFKEYLTDHPFTLKTDCMAITYVMNSDKATGMLARWKLRFSQFPCEKIEHCRGTQNIVSDTLSRMFDGEENKNEPDPPSVNKVCFLQNFPETFDTLTDKQRDDAELGKTIRQLENGEQVQHFCLKNGILKFQKNKKCPPKVVVPKSMRTMLMKYFHDISMSAHWGIKKTIARISKNFTWEGMFNDVKQYVKSCELCQLSKPAQNRQVGLMNSKPPTKCLERLHIDIFGPLVRSTSGNAYALVCIDTFSKFSWVIPLRKATSKTIISALKDRIFSQHGLPEIICSDNASVFTSQSFKSFLFGLSIKHITTSVARPNSNQSERVNRNLKFVLKIFHSESQNKWDENLPFLCLGLNSGVHESTGVTPAYAFLGREINHSLKLQWNLDDDLPVETAQERVAKIIENLKAAHSKTRERYNENRKPSRYCAGDLVVYRRFVPSNKMNKVSNKLSQPWSGPFKVIKILNPVNIKIQLLSDSKVVKVVHVAQVKKYFERTQSENAQ